MKRVYTDERFPGLEVVNFGDTRFIGFKDGQQVEAFSSYEGSSECVSEAFAQRRANDYFDRLTEHLELPVTGEVKEELKKPEGVKDSDSVPVQIVGYLLAD